MTKLRIFLDSGANVYSCHDQVFTFEELGLTEEEWDSMTEKKQDEFAREIAFNRAEWGYHKVDDNKE